MSSSCCCSSSSVGTQPLPTPLVKGADQVERHQYEVLGMTCGHCVAAVTGEVGAIPGVHDVSVDLASRSLSFSAQAPVDRAAVSAAVETAGYRLA